MAPGRLRRRSVLCLMGGAALCALTPRRLMAEELTRDEQRRLAEHEAVRVPLDLELAEGAYFGGLVYQVVDATVDEIMAIAGDPEAYTAILSATREVRVLARRGSDLQVYLSQGSGLVSVNNVVLMRREAPGLLRFWLDPSEPHDLDDGWGFLRVEPWAKPPWLKMSSRPGPRSLITWGVLMRIDSPDIKLRYSEVVRRAVMETAGRIVSRHLRASISAGARRGNRAEK